MFVFLFARLSSHIPIGMRLPSLSSFSSPWRKCRLPVLFPPLLFLFCLYFGCTPLQICCCFFVTRLWGLFCYPNPDLRNKKKKNKNELVNKQTIATDTTSSSHWLCAHPASLWSWGGELLLSTHLPLPPQCVDRNLPDWMEHVQTG